jgi:hypothetical protein
MTSGHSGNYESGEIPGYEGTSPGNHSGLIKKGKGLFTFGNGRKTKILEPAEHRKTRSMRHTGKHPFPTNWVHPRIHD